MGPIMFLIAVLVFALVAKSNAAAQRAKESARAEERWEAFQEDRSARQQRRAEQEKAASKVIEAAPE